MAYKQTTYGQLHVLTATAHQVAKTYNHLPAYFEALGDAADGIDRGELTTDEAREQVRAAAYSNIGKQHRAA